MNKDWEFKAGHVPYNKGKTNKELGIESKRKRRILSMTPEDKGRFVELLKNKTVADVARIFKMRDGDACQLQHELTTDYTRSTKNHNRKLTKYQVIKILIMIMRDGARQKDLAEIYGVSASNISNICAGRHWKHVFQGAKDRYNIEILSIVEKSKAV